MPGEATLQRKGEYVNRVKELFTQYNQILICNADNVGSAQFQKIRSLLRGKAIILMGKNSLIRRAVREMVKVNKSLEALQNHIKQNVGFVFCTADLQEVKKIIKDCRVGAPARVGSVAPVDVMIPAGPTGMDPTMTSFLQALNISSKINKGQVEIISDVHLIKKGDKVGSSEATLLEKLKIKPFSYGLGALSVYDNGTVYSADALDLSDEDILKGFSVAVDNVACLSLGASFPNTVSAPHMLLNGFKNILAVGFAVEGYSFKQLDALKAGAAAAAAAPAPAKEEKKGGGAAPKKEEKKKEPEPEPEEEEDMGMGLFD